MPNYRFASNWFAIFISIFIEKWVFVHMIMSLKQNIFFITFTLRYMSYLVSSVHQLHVANKNMHLVHFTYLKLDFGGHLEFDYFPSWDSWGLLICLFRTDWVVPEKISLLRIYSTLKHNVPGVTEQSMFSKAECGLKWNMCISKILKSTFGVLQGGMISPKLFTEFLQDIAI